MEYVDTSPLSPKSVKAFPFVPNPRRISMWIPAAAPMCLSPEPSPKPQFPTTPVCATYNKQEKKI